MTPLEQLQAAKYALLATKIALPDCEPQIQVFIDGILTTVKHTGNAIVAGFVSSVDDNTPKGSLDELLEKIGVAAITKIESSEFGLFECASAVLDVIEPAEVAS